MFRNFKGTHVIFLIEVPSRLLLYYEGGLFTWVMLGHLKVIVSDRAGEPKLPLNDEITIAIIISH